MPADKDLFAEEHEMTAMSFGEHIEELRARLILALTGLMAGVIVTFIPPLNLGKLIMTQMEGPAQVPLTKFYTNQAIERGGPAEKAPTVPPPTDPSVPADALIA